MSIAGVYSNRGDIYQKLIAFKWALKVLVDPEFQWIEIDSNSYLVDDVVIGKSDGSIICCQCKKNQSQFNEWKISDLINDIDKALETLDEYENATVIFYSRNNFGKISQLREKSCLHIKSEFYKNLKSTYKSTNDKLSERIIKLSLNISTYQFLKRTNFFVTNEFSEIEAQLRERLQYLVSNSNNVFNALWVFIDKLGARISTTQKTTSIQHRLTKSDICNIVYEAGGMLVPPILKEKIQESFSRISSIGRSWQQDIAGKQIYKSVVNDILKEILRKKKSIILLGSPGVGKTCIMLKLQEKLEEFSKTKSDLVPLFLQSREYADINTAQDREAYGLPAEWVQEASRLAEIAHVVVVFDSLDVLSIAREHSILSYFLAQIDQLIKIPNITVVTACREFDYKYDRRIAVRKWDCEFNCKLLEWESEVLPFLENLGFDPSIIDVTTRELIRNPRELSLYVELAQRNGCFNVITSQKLSQEYLETFIQSDSKLGIAAMKAIESLANDMLELRRMSIPKQRFIGTSDILRRLYSLNVLKINHEGNLFFGHQTLLDTLVISSAVRNNISIDKFIKQLPPVPFVRPSIRSFVEYLSSGDRKNFRKNVRAVLTGTTAFHFRRLIAEVFALQKPQKEDWSLIRDLRKNHKEVYQVIYTSSSDITWHYFWMTNLVPLIENQFDKEGLFAHVFQIKRWINDDPQGISEFLEKVYSYDWIDIEKLENKIVYALSKVKKNSLKFIYPLLKKILQNTSFRFSVLGELIAHCVNEGVADDNLLWSYITGKITEKDVLSYRIDKKLKCESHCFGRMPKDFFLKRMVKSNSLLDIVLNSIEKWISINTNRYGESKTTYNSVFLHNSSYMDAHSKTDFKHKDSLRILLDAVQAAILFHVRQQSKWWAMNKKRICFSRNLLFSYFAIYAFTESPKLNIDLIGSLVTDKDLLKSELSYEICDLLNLSFIDIDIYLQDKAMFIIETLWQEKEFDENKRDWILRERVEYGSAIPSNIRTENLQTLLNVYQKKFGIITRQPAIIRESGWVGAPFKLEVFQDLSADSIITLLNHYFGHKNSFDDFLLGGERHISGLLSNASSTQPGKFLDILVSQWENISPVFRDDIVSGIANYLNYEYGSLQPNSSWKLKEKADCITIVNDLIIEMNRHSSYWAEKSPKARFVESAAHVVCDLITADELICLAQDFLDYDEEFSMDIDDANDLITDGLNMLTGHIVEGLMNLSNCLIKKKIQIPKKLNLLLVKFINKNNPAIKSLILRHLPVIQNKNPEFGWNLFDLVMSHGTGLWQYAENCLYYSYKKNSKLVFHYLKCIYHGGTNKDLETWGRIGALNTLAGYIDFQIFIFELNQLEKVEAWKGAFSVWTHGSNIKCCRDQCLSGLKLGLSLKNSFAKKLVHFIEDIFRYKKSTISLPVDIIELFFNIKEKDSEENFHSVSDFENWLDVISLNDPELALIASEFYLSYMSKSKSIYYDHKNRIVHLMTRLFAEAEEREDTDNGKMLFRVVKLQDLLLAMGVESMNEWLKASERQ